MDKKKDAFPFPYGDGLKLDPSSLSVGDEVWILFDTETFLRDDEGWPITLSNQVPKKVVITRILSEIDIYVSLKPEYDTEVCENYCFKNEVYALLYKRLCLTDRINQINNAINELDKKLPTTDECYNDKCINFAGDYKCKLQRPISRLNDCKKFEKK
jgi:hypothetical protein